MNIHIEMVKKWLNDRHSVTFTQLEIGKLFASAAEHKGCIAAGVIDGGVAHYYKTSPKLAALGCAYLAITNACVAGHKIEAFDYWAGCALEWVTEYENIMEGDTGK